MISQSTVYSSSGSESSSWNTSMISQSIVYSSSGSESLSWNTSMISQSGLTPPHFILSHARSWNSNVICRGSVYMFNEMRGD
jgi:hypothetical protein